MHICLIGKYPPIEGGVSTQSYWTARSLGAAGHEVSVVTNADEVEEDYRIWIPEEDRDRLEMSWPTGGRVTVTSTSWLNRQRMLQIPQSDVYVTKLASLATDMIRDRECELVYSYYFEPYAMAGHLASAWTGVPHIVQHAGSDRTGLLANPELGTAYREVLRAADAVISPVAGGLAALGIPTDRIYQPLSGFLPDLWADRSDNSLTINQIIARLAGRHNSITNTQPMPDDLPTIAIYGKAGQTKGTYDLVAALSTLHDRGLRFGFVVVGGGSERTRLMERITECRLADMTWTLPFIPHWRVPDVLREVTAVCCLERDFSISMHTPSLPKEVLAAGTCLVLSREVAEKQLFNVSFIDGQTGFVVPDPANVPLLADVLAAIITDPLRANAIGKAGAAVPRLKPEAQLASHYGEIFTDTLLRSRRAGRAEGAPGGSRPQPSVLAALSVEIPATAALLGDALATAAGVVPRRDMTPTGPRQLLRIVGRVRDWAAARPAALGACPAWVVDFECNVAWARLGLGDEERMPRFAWRGARSMLLSRQARLDACRPVASNWMRVGRYPRNIDEIVATIRSCGPRSLAASGDCGVGDTPFLFLKDSSLIGTTVRVTDDVAWLLSICDGMRSYADITRICEEERGISEPDVRLAIRDLAEHGAVYL